ncbi:MAG: CsgG/HfaB family protein [Elusimicrobiota bacterium]
MNKIFLKKLIRPSLLFVFILAAAGCGPKIAFRENYDFSEVERVGIIKFDSSGVDFTTGSDPGSAIADEFVFQLLHRGVRVVERSRLESILREHNLWKSGDINSETIREMGQILGVDAIVMGTVTRYNPDRKERIYIKDSEGRVREEIFMIDAEVGISARMVDTQSGEVIWASSYVSDSFYMDTAIRQAVSAILNSLSGIWFI